MKQPTLLDFGEIRARAKALAERLGEPDFSVRSRPTHDGSPHVEVTDAYYWVVTERGQEIERRRTMDVDELLYWLLAGLTFSMAIEYELTRRRTGEDTRRQWFAKEVELLEELSPDWADRKRREQAETLKRHPYQDQ
jgi:hypothetical protein